MSLPLNCNSAVINKMAKVATLPFTGRGSMDHIDVHMVSGDTMDHGLPHGLLCTCHRSQHALWWWWQYRPQTSNHPSGTTQTTGHHHGPQQQHRPKTPTWHQWQSRPLTSKWFQAAPQTTDIHVAFGGNIGYKHQQVFNRTMDPDLAVGS